MNAPFNVDVSGARGAPMGRKNTFRGPPARNELVRLAAVPLDPGGYDPGGAYWGTRSAERALWCAWNDHGALYFEDALDVAHARGQAEALLSGARIQPIHAPAKEGEPDEPREVWADSSGRVELFLTRDEAESVSGPGDATAAAEALCLQPRIRAQLDALNPADVRAALAEIGAWDDTELSDRAENNKRLLWIAGCDIVEEAER